MSIQLIRRIAGRQLCAFLIGALWLAAPAPTAAQAPGGLSAAERDVLGRVKERRIVEATKTLADDRFEGRGTLQPCGEKAAAWIADRMKRLGLAPGGDGGSYMQRVPLVATEFVEPTHVTVDGTPLTYGTDWSTFGTFADLQARGPLIFVGHGVVSKTFGRDDLKGVDLAGKGHGRGREHGLHAVGAAGEG